MHAPAKDRRPNEPAAFYLSLSARLKRGAGRGRIIDYISA
jgi:hypothetical protein